MFNSATTPWPIDYGCCECRRCAECTPHSIFPDRCGTVFICMVCREEKRFGRFQTCPICKTWVEIVGGVMQVGFDRVVAKGEDEHAHEKRWPVVKWQPTLLPHACAAAIASPLVSEKVPESNLPPA